MYWAVAQSLFSAQARHPNRIGIDPLNLELIYGSLRHIARNQHENLIGTLKRLAVLEVRFHRKYLREEEMDWTREFDTTTEFFDNITTMSPRELADSLTYSDIEEFRLLRPQNIINGDSYLQHLHRQWNRRCQAAQECLAVGTRPSTLLTALAKASIFLPFGLKLLKPRSGITRQAELLQLVRYTPSSTRDWLR